MTKLIHRIHRLMPYIFWLGFFATIFVTLMPSKDIPQSFIFWDKAQHALAFLLLMLTGGLAYLNKSTWVFVGLIFYGASIELMQKYFTSTRSGDIFDLIADTVGIILGWLIFKIAARFLQKSAV